MDTEDEQPRGVILRLTNEQALDLSDILVMACDEGPEGEGWASDELKELRKIVRETIDAN